MRALVVAVALALLIPAASAQVRDSGQSTVLPGELNLPVQAGTFIPDNCPVGPGTQVFPIPTCIAFPMGEGALEAQSAYMRALEQAGWRFASGAANVLFFERPTDRPNCSRQVLMIGWLLGDPAEIAKYGRQDEPTMDWSRIEYGTFIFLLTPDDVCGEDRHLR
ncbi:MAG: hypothetical protein AB7O98_18110 [Hyphomonadaceae bacterium]